MDGKLCADRFCCHVNKILVENLDVFIVAYLNGILNYIEDLRIGVEKDKRRYYLSPSPPPMQMTINSSGLTRLDFAHCSLILQHSTDRPTDRQKRFAPLVDHATGRLLKATSACPRRKAQ